MKLLTAVFAACLFSFSFANATTFQCGGQSDYDYKLTAQFDGDEMLYTLIAPKGTDYYTAHDQLITLLSTRIDGKNTIYAYGYSSFMGGEYVTFEITITNGKTPLDSSAKMFVEVPEKYGGAGSPLIGACRSM